MIEFLYIGFILCAGIISGLFFVFSNTVMSALHLQKEKNATITMQAINDIILNPLFFIIFFGTPILACIIIVQNILNSDMYNIANIGAVIYILGSFGVTLGKNVPMNNILKNIQTDSSEVTYWNTYYKKWGQPFVLFDDIKKFPESETQKTIQEKIKEADELILICPMWWYDVPSIMRNFFDMNFTAGFAYKYKSNGLPEGLLKGKTAKMIITYDGPKWLHWIQGNLMKKTWKRGRLGFCGVKITDFVLFDNKRKKDIKGLQKYIEKVKKIAEA